MTLEDTEAIVLIVILEAIVVVAGMMGWICWLASESEWQHKMDSMVALERMQKTKIGDLEARAERAEAGFDRARELMELTMTWCGGAEYEQRKGKEDGK